MLVLILRVYFTTMVVADDPNYLYFALFPSLLSRSLILILFMPQTAEMDQIKFLL